MNVEDALKRAAQLHAASEATDDEALLLGQVLGECLARIRKQRNLTQHELSHKLLVSGLKWPRARIAAFESGKRGTVDLGEVFGLCLALDVPGSELFDVEDEDRQVRLTPTLVVRCRDVAEWLSSAVVPAGIVPQIEGESVSALFKDMSRREGPFAAEADVALAKRLGVEPSVVANQAAHLWNSRSLTEERDRRVEALREMPIEERQAHRGHITRELAAEIEKALKRKGAIQ